MNSLPCVMCGNLLSGLVEGTVVQCFACGTDNVLVESTDALSKFALEYYSWNRLPQVPGGGLPTSSVGECVQVSEKIFQDFLNERQKFDKVLVTRVDADVPSDEEVHEIGMKFGFLACILANFVFPATHHLGNEPNLREIFYKSRIENLVFTALHHSIVSKKAFELEEAANSLKLCSRNLQKAAEICREAEASEWHLDFGDEELLLSLGAEFSEYLIRALTENPAYYSQELEDLVVKLNTLEFSRARVLKSQVQRIYVISTSVQFYLEELRNRDPFGEIDVYQEHSLDHVEDKISNCLQTLEWLRELRDKFKKNQMELMKLHLGKFVPYLKTYRAEFESRFEATTKFFDEMLEKIIKNANSDYGIEYFELFDEVEELITLESVGEDELINRLAATHDDLEQLDEKLKHLVFELFKLAQERNLQKLFLAEIISSISEKHSHFDLKILDFINALFKHFQDYRNENRLTIEQQREYFLSDLQPKVRKLIDASFTLKEENIPYPIFMELILVDTDLRLNESHRITMVIENPSLVTIRGVSVTFFVPNSFDIMHRTTSLSRLKPWERKSVTTDIIPTEKGPYHLMCMVQYEHVNESFWIPSVKIEVFVRGEGDEDVDLETLLQRGKGDAGEGTELGEDAAEGRKVPVVDLSSPPEKRPPETED
ncbi:MAG: hypothetical protein ACTSU5_11735 [Promethearchaeota archaeon]